MSILYLSTFDPTARSQGTSTRGRLFLEYLARHFSVHLVHMNEKDKEGRQEKTIEKLSSIQRIEYDKLSYFLWSPKLYSAAHRTLEEREISMIFADFEKSGYYAYILSKKFDVPYVYSSHNVEYKRYISLSQKNILRYLFVPYMYWMERQACRGSYYTISISKKDAKSLREWIPEDKLKVMPCAFDEEVYNPFYESKKGDERERVLMVGNYRNAGNRQAAELLVEKIRPEVLQKRKRVVFRCVGKHFPKELEVENVSAPGFVDSLVEEYRRAAVVVAPVKMGGGIKIKVVEALACGKPLVATEKALEGIDESRLHNLEKANVKNFAKVIIRMLKKDNKKTSKNWSYVKNEFGKKSQLDTIRRLIEEVSAKE